MKKETSDWKAILAESVVTAEHLARHFPVKQEQVQKVIERYPLRINPYYLSLIEKPHDPIWRQVMPDIAEINDQHGWEDPLSENDHSPVSNLIHRYPDRVVLLVSSQCAVYCRYCMRKRKVGKSFSITAETIEAGIGYIRDHVAVRDVILSGGDPLLLDDNDLCHILENIRRIPHVEIIRIHTRAPCTLPQRITRNLSQMMKAFHPLYINVHINHLDEITDQAALACNLLADAGIPLGCQTVLLKGVNDDPGVMKSLMQKLLTIRVKPYYLHHPDLVRGTQHFQTTPDVGLSIMGALRGHTSGLCFPHYVVDLPGGGGKIPLHAEYVVEKRPDKWLIRNYTGKIYEYPII
ncbi:MAG: KamA family radical SAM protein [Candidatus Desulfatibia sp.]|uniref:KamA family radical SAM protein n=1 Tax=Candidatus Desulfatibia sp. TaxID=3101189 RepID=UPI002F2C91B7